MRSPTSLRVFPLADDLAVAVYKLTTDFPSDERFGLVSQMRRAAVSIPSNLAEGCSRPGEREFAQFVTIAHGSALELQYQLSLAARLEFATPEAIQPIVDRVTTVAKMLNALARASRSHVPRSP